MIVLLPGAYGRHAPHQSEAVRQPSSMCGRFHSDSTRAKGTSAPEAASALGDDRREGKPAGSLFALVAALIQAAYAIGFGRIKHLTRTVPHAGTVGHDPPHLGLANSRRNSPAPAADELARKGAHVPQHQSPVTAHEWPTEHLWRTSGPLGR